MAKQNKMDMKEKQQDKRDKKNTDKKDDKVMKDVPASGKKKATKSGGQEEDWHQKYNELDDKYLRLYSEFDNYRKRTLKEKIDLSRIASEEIITALLPVMDDLERALKAGSEGENLDEHLKGVELIYNKFRTTLEQRGLKPIPAIGELFDVDYHDALTNIPATSEDMKGRVVDEIEKGYTLNGKVIRYAKVVVGS